MQVQKGLVDINTVLDTRMGTMLRIDPDAANFILRSPLYPLRATDNFFEMVDGKIPDETYRELYGQYDVETLASSLMTDMLYRLNVDVRDQIAEWESKKEEGVVAFDINVYPYKLAKEEKEVLRRAIASKLDASCEVRTVDIAWHLLTPGSIATNYDMLLIYNYEDWLRYHLETLLKDPIRDFVVMYPRIAHTGVVSESTNDVKDPFMAAPMTLHPYIQLQPLPVGYFCWNPAIYDDVNGLPGSRQDSEAARLVRTPLD